jgi:hypothetical protein
VSARAAGRRLRSWLTGSLVGVAVVYLLLIVGGLVVGGRFWLRPLPNPFGLLDRTAEGLFPWGLWPFVWAWAASALLPSRVVFAGALLTAVLLLGAAVMAEGVSV